MYEHSTCYYHICHPTINVQQELQRRSLVTFPKAENHANKGNLCAKTKFLLCRLPAILLYYYCRSLWSYTYGWAVLNIVGVPKSSVEARTLNHSLLLGTLEGASCMTGIACYTENVHVAFCRRVHVRAASESTTFVIPSKEALSLFEALLFAMSFQCYRRVYVDS